MKADLITAVVLHYYPERTGNIKRIVGDLQSGTEPPDKIIVFNNNPSIRLGPIDGASVINSDTNYGGRARYPVALLEPSDCYFFIDDDVTVRKNTIKNFLRYASGYCCLGYVGKVVGKDYSDSETFFGDKVKEVKNVDLLVGCGTIFVSFSALTNMFGIEEQLLNDNYSFGREEDIILSMSNKPMVIPARPSEFIENLQDGGVGYCTSPKHIDLRNKMVLRIKGTKLYHI